MLQIRDISKTYVTDALTQTALDHVSFNLRSSEFVAVLGPSGSGKTTLLNVIGGLDRYDSGDLIISGVSTKKYTDRDWDSYRNHTIGFVFQSYNLIPHQSVLANVELALTISGIPKRERREKARAALERVGLGDQLHKRPNQMSGGQMQRVAIARALVNDPDILLADEPTGALDSDTSVQVMELLKEVARDRLVILVTHNGELAGRYATRILRLRDGRVTDDSNPYEVDEAKLAPPEHRNLGRSSMSFLTALSLSFNNLRTKLGRTLLTAFAGSIGIIGIALILSLSTGVDTYITDLQKSTMTSYPITIEAQAVDLSSLMEARGGAGAVTAADHPLDGVYADGSELERASSMTSSMTKNNLTAFKKYLDDPNSEIRSYIGENGIVYGYGTNFGVYTLDPDGVFVNTDGSTLESESVSLTGMQGVVSFSGTGNSNFAEMLPGRDGALVSTVVTDSYDVLSGRWPAALDEVVLVTDENNEISAAALYDLGMLPSADYNALMKKIKNGESVTVDTRKFTYAELCSQALYLIPACDTYAPAANGTYASFAGDAAKMEALFDSAMRLKIVGVVRPREDAAVKIGAAVGYTRSLTDFLISATASSAVVRAQEASPNVNILNGMTFDPADDSARIADAKTYLSGLGVSDKAAMCRQILGTLYAGDAAKAAQLAAMSETELAAALDSYLLRPDDSVLLEIYNSSVSAGSYDDNMSAFGAVSTDAPASISIYVDSFEDKDSIASCIADYNAGAAEEDQITYTDYVGLLMRSVTTIVNVISYVLIAFVGVSLVVSSIMIGIITYISVLERTKEIGILRAIGASRHNISQVFNAETLIVGLCSGLIGVALSLVLLIPGNAAIHHWTGSDAVNAYLSPVSAAVLVALSMVLTLIAGLIPSGKAARKDPVVALRSE